MTATPINLNSNFKEGDNRVFDTFEVNFGIENNRTVNYYSGILNVLVKNNKPYFYDITKIRKKSSVTTDDNTSATVTSFDNSIP